MPMDPIVMQWIFKPISWVRRLRCRGDVAFKVHDGTAADIV